MEASRATVAKPALGPATARLLADYLTLTKPRVQSLLLFTTVTTMFVAGTPSAKTVLLTVWNVVRSMKKGVTAGPDPWKANTLEWFVPSPPPVNNFDVVPRVRSVEPMKDIRRQVARQSGAPVELGPAEASH